ncbi:MAG: hypothetical protein EP329_06670 [Deltaproteobacteria bacterium]|nr:MAG: hypothetical protein EP329_06670 [Deltaproteobacteria bacterium]
MRTRLLLTLALVTFGIANPNAAHALPDGGYIGLGFGAGLASGDRGVPLEAGAVSISGGSAVQDEVVRTDFGTGLAFELRFGYLIQKLVGLDIGLTGHGTTSFDDGAGFVSLTAHYHFLQHAIDLSERAFDVDVYFGGGYAIGGYHPDFGDAKGWEGSQVNFGVDFEYQVGERVGLAIDCKFVLPQYTTFIVDYDDDIRVDPAETPSSLVVVPTIQLIFHL